MILNCCKCFILNSLLKLLCRSTYVQGNYVNLFILFYLQIVKGLKQNMGKYAWNVQSTNVHSCYLELHILLYILLDFFCRI